MIGFNLECITDEFLISLKNELDNNLKDESIIPDNPTYWNYYQWFDHSEAFKTALQTTCYLHNLNDFYDYIRSLNYDKQDLLEEEIVELLYKRGIIEEGNIDDTYPIPFKFVVPDLNETDEDLLCDDLDEDDIIN